MHSSLELESLLYLPPDVIGVSPSLLNSGPSSRSHLPVMVGSSPLCHPAIFFCSELFKLWKLL